MVTKRCTGPCGLEKELNKDNFYWVKSRNRWRPKCRTCLGRILPFGTRTKFEQIILIDGIEHKECSKCNKFKTLNCFAIRPENGRYRLLCKPCFAESRRPYNKVWSNNHKEHQQVLSKESYEKNKKKIRAREQERRKNDPEFRIRRDVSRVVNLSLKKENGSKNNMSVTKFLDMEKIKEHLESLFEPWMNWKNQKPYNPKTWDDNDPSTWVWHIDHIIPQLDLPFSEMSHDPESNFQKCWALSNIRPLSAKQNLQDGASRVRHKHKRGTNRAKPSA